MPFDSPSDIIFFKRNCLLLSTKPLETHSKCLNFYRCGPISNLHMKCKLNILLILKKGSTNWARRKKPNILSIIQNERKKNRIKDTLFSEFVWSVTDQIKFNKLVFRTARAFSLVRMVFHLYFLADDFFFSASSICLSATNHIHTYIHCLVLSSRHFTVVSIGLRRKIVVNIYLYPKCGLHIAYCAQSSLVNNSF